MKNLTLVLLLSICGALPAAAQEACEFFSDKAFDKLAKALSHAKSCTAAAAKMHDCAWGSSADTQLAPIAVAKCEKTFLGKLSAPAKKRYYEEMQLCAYQFARQTGTMYMSAAALCQVDVAAHFAGAPEIANQPSPRAGFDCDKARTPLETAICSDIRLGHADIVLSRVYAGLMKHSAKEERAALVQSEKQWLRGIPAKCGLSQGPLTAESLNCVRNEFELRFTALDGCSGSLSFCLQSSVDEDESAPAAASVSGPRASFDCEKPSTALEIAICADAELGQTDIKLAQAYHDADQAMKMQHAGLVDSQRQWLRFVSGSCPLGTIGGIPHVIARSCIKRAFETRITQLQKCPQKEMPERMPCLNDFQLLERQQDAP